MLSTACKQHAMIVNWLTGDDTHMLRRSDSYLVDPGKLELAV